MQFRYRMMVVVFGAFIYSTTGMAGHLSMKAYLEQVRSQNKSVQAAKERKEAAAGSAVEAKLLTAPSIFAHAEHSIDKKETPSPAFQGTETRISNLVFGMQKQFDFGLRAKAYYAFAFGEVKGTNPMFIPPGKGHYQGAPTVELSQSLWRNALGRETRAMKDLAQIKSATTDLSENMRVRMLMLNAKMAYLMLSLARENSEAQKLSLDRAMEMRSWTQKQAALELSDGSDAMQAEALVKVRQLELKVAQDNIRAAEQDFNSMRGIATDRVGDALDPLNSGTLASLREPKQHGLREDARLADEAIRIADLQLALINEKFKPDLEIFASLATNGRDPIDGKSFNKSFDSKNPTYTVGLRVTAPLGRDTIGRVRDGAGHEKMAAELTAQRASFDNEQTWVELRRMFQESKERLVLASELEKAQKTKLEKERSRRLVGRTTMAQIIMFEQDYVAAQINRIRFIAEVLRNHIQLESFAETIL